MSIVLASFMAGLALGGFCLGWLAGRLRRPLAVYAGLEFGVAVFALALPTLLRGVDGLYVAMARGPVGQLSGAIAALQKALELNPDDARMQEKLARLQSLRAQR